MEEKILDYIMEQACDGETVTFRSIEEEFKIIMDEKLKEIIRDALWDRVNVSDVFIENEGYVISVFQD